MRLRIAPDAYFTRRYADIHPLQAPLQRYGFWLLCLLTAVALFHHEQMARFWLPGWFPDPALIAAQKEVELATNPPDLFPAPEEASPVASVDFSSFPPLAPERTPPAILRPPLTEPAPPEPVSEALELEESEDPPEEAPEAMAEPPETTSQDPDWLARLKEGTPPSALQAELEESLTELEPEARPDAWQAYLQALVAHGRALARKNRLRGKPDSVQAIAAYLRGLDRPEAAGALGALADAVAEHGWAQIQARKYTTPRGDNAHATLQTVLTIHPRHARARQGIARIGRKYLYIAKDLVDKGKSDRALFMLDKGLAVSPDDKELKSLRAEVHAKLTDPAVLQLQRAQNQLASGKLIKPKGDNAYQTFLEILRAQPDHAEARQGVRQVIQKLYNRALAAKRRGDLEASWLMVQDAISQFPKEDRFFQLQDAIREATEAERGG